MSKKKILLIIVSAAVATLCIAAGIVYFNGVSRYKTHFLRGTRINGIDCSDLEPGEVCAILDAQISDYVLEVSGRNPANPEETAVLGTITPGDVGLCRKDTAVYVNDVFEKQNPYAWYQCYWKEGAEYSFEQEIVFEQERLVSFMSGWEACIGTTAVDPQDAHVSEYVAEENAYHVVPETIGSRMDGAKAIPAIEKALYTMEKQVDIEATGCYNSAKIKADDVNLNRVVDQVNSWLGSSIHYNWYGTELTVDAELLKDWVSLKDGQPVLDEEAVREYVEAAKKSYDPIGKTYVFHTSLGADLKLKCKSGWITDPEKETEELIALIKEGAVTDREPISTTKQFSFFDSGVGNSYAEVDLSNQHMYFYDQGELLLETDFVSGDVATGHATPEGIFAVTYKQKDRILRGPGYESFVHYWMPFYGGYGMHDATWRKVFGGSIFLENGSHGCVNLPLKNAEKIYDCVEAGFPVICYYYPQGKNPKENEALAAAGEAQAARENANGPAQGTSNENGEAPEGEQLTEDNEIHGQW